ncbi:hypothetical protein [Streptococcus hyointestinalis]|uniref:hypothetical protein n=1 Tax=Streptococcus hyointestinalis TaxID=1337 RepID=UPI0013E073C3|nr:hypothetical protein [Streptococcus hyointestinalis]
MQKIYYRLSSLFIALTLLADGVGIVFLLVSRGTLRASPGLLRFGVILNALVFLLFLAWSSYHLYQAFRQKQKWQPKAWQIGAFTVLVLRTLNYVIKEKDWLFGLSMFLGYSLVLYLIPYYFRSSVK